MEEDVLRNGAQAKGMKDGLWEIGTRGMDELITARRELKAANGKVSPGNVMPLFLSVVSRVQVNPTNRWSAHEYPGPRGAISETTGTTRL